MHSTFILWYKSTIFPQTHYNGAKYKQLLISCSYILVKWTHNRKNTNQISPWIIVYKKCWPSLVFIHFFCDHLDNKAIIVKWHLSNRYSHKGIYDLLFEWPFFYSWSMILQSNIDWVTIAVYAIYQHKHYLT